MEIITKIPAAGPKEAPRLLAQSPKVEPLICVTWKDESNGTPTIVETPK